jgi:histone-binding protein RBBP4
MEVGNIISIIGPILKIVLVGHTARPTDFGWAPGVEEQWTGVSTSEDNVVMIWQPTMRVWAGDEVKIDEKELESDAMEGIEITEPVGKGKSRSSASASGD